MVEHRRSAGPQPRSHSHGPEEEVRLDPEVPRKNGQAKAPEVADESAHVFAAQNERGDRRERDLQAVVTRLWQEPIPA
jgi:hypothetical protein